MRYRNKLWEPTIEILGRWGQLLLLSKSSYSVCKN